jgi:hypothetical protein
VVDIRPDCSSVYMTVRISRQVWHGGCIRHRTDDENKRSASVALKNSRAKHSVERAKRTRKTQGQTSGSEEAPKARRKADQFQQMEGAESTYFKKA